jgi:hypothetical protein
MSKSNVCGIRVEQSDKDDCLIMWDIEKNKEIESFDCDNNALFFQDSNGNPYIAERDYIINCSQGCKIKCFDFSIDDIGMNNCTFGPHSGFRVDV